MARTKQQASSRTVQSGSTSRAGLGATSRVEDQEKSGSMNVTDEGESRAHADDGPREDGADEEDATTDEEDVYQVEKILKSRMVRGKKQYYVKWVGYNDEADNTWEPLANLCGCEELLANFEADELAKAEAAQEEAESDGGGEEEEEGSQGATQTGRRSEESGDDDEDDEDDDAYVQEESSEEGDTSDEEYVPEGAAKRRKKEPLRRSRPLAPRELQRLREALRESSATKLSNLIEGLAEAHPWLLEEVHARLAD